MIPDVRGQVYSRTITARTWLSSEDSPVDDVSAAGAGDLVPSWQIGWSKLQSHADVLAAFLDIAGPYGSTEWFDWIATARNDNALGVGDGLEDTFTLPAKETTGWAIYDDATPKVKDVDWTLSVGTGANGEDQAVFGAPPLAGHAIAADVTGRQLWLVRFVDSRWGRRLLPVNLKGATQFDLVALSGYLPPTPAVSTLFPLASVSYGEDDLSVKQTVGILPMSVSRVVRLRQHLRPRHSFSRAFSAMSDAEAEAILDHQVLAGGRLTAFTLIDQTSGSWRWVPMDSGDGSTGPYDLPGVETSGQTVYADGVAITGTISAGTGTHGRDEFTADSAVTAGARLSATLTGRRAWIVRYGADSVVFSRDPDFELWQCAIPFMEVR